MPGLTTSRLQSARDVLASALISARKPDGGWGASATAPSNSECTALAVLALRSAPADRVITDAIDAAATWLLGRQLPDGAWRYHDEGPATSWPTPIALLALRSRADAEAARARGLGWLLDMRGESYPLLLRIREFFSRNRDNELDATLEGWPWVPGTFAWVEPTSWALLALKGWPSAPTRAMRARIREAEEMLIDRACIEGGWNYGNKRVLGEELDPYPDTTALALLGLRGRSTPVVESGFTALDRLLGDHASGLALSLAVLAQRAWSRDTAGLGARVMQSYEAHDRFAHDHRALALAALALAPHIDWLEPRNV